MEVAMKRLQNLHELELNHQAATVMGSVPQYSHRSLSPGATLRMPAPLQMEVPS